MLLAMKTRNQYLVSFDPSIVRVKQSPIVSQIVSCSLVVSFNLFCRLGIDIVFKNWCWLLLEGKGLYALARMRLHTSKLITNTDWCFLFDIYLLNFTLQ